MTVDAFYDDVQEMLESDDPEFQIRGEIILCERDAAHRDDVLVQYLIASAYDRAGREADALQHYERALALGVDRLPIARQPEIFVQAGSTLRNLGRLDEARTVLERGIELFPAYRALRVFLALVESRAENHVRATLVLLDVVVMDDDPSVLRYRRSLRWYVDDFAGRHDRTT